MENYKLQDFGLGPVKIFEGKFYTPDPVPTSMINEENIFVFGSNTMGEHFGGAARVAHQDFKAEWGLGEGFSGWTYAIPSLNFANTTKNKYTGPHLVSHDELLASFIKFKEFAILNPKKRFFLTKIGLGIAGWKLSEVFKIFWDSRIAIEAHNVVYPIEFEMPENAIYQS